MFLLLPLIAFLGCEKEKNAATADLLISYAVNGQPFYFDSLMYVNSAGNQYEVNRLEYYISSIALHTPGGQIVEFDSVFYINADDSRAIELVNVPEGRYSRITFNVGVDSVHNISYQLPNTPENINMAWPDMMGGGYHFMKFEGHYLVSGIPNGYAVHLGRNKHLVACIVSKTFDISPGHNLFNLEMDIGQWFRDPYDYNLDTDGNYTMSNDSAMSKIASNGTDVFTLK